jgi:hypothetical protein
MRDARHLACDRVRNGRMRRHTTARRGRRDGGALQHGCRNKYGSAEQRVQAAHRG